MKLIGKNSASTFLCWLFFGFFVLTTLHLLYEIIAHSILFYKFKTGIQIFSETFILGNDVGWAKNKWTIPMNEQLKFKINYPFSNTQLVTGLYEPFQIFFNLIAFIFFSAFFYFSYKSFKEMSCDRIFNSNAIKWLKRLAFVSIFFSIISIIPHIIFYKMTSFAFLQFFFIGFFGIIILFIVEFFKKGYELQSENDLTI